MIRKLITFVAICFPLFANAQSTLTKKYKKASFQNVGIDWVDSLAKISFYSTGKASSFSTPKEKPTKYSMHSLDSGVQKQLIKAYAAEVNKDTSKSVTDLICYECKTKVPKSGAKRVDNQTYYSKKMIFDISSPYAKGRIANLSIKFDLENIDNIELVSFNGLNTKEEIIDFGKINLTKNRSFNLTAGVELGSTGATTVATSTESDSSNFQKGDSTTGNLAAGYSSGRTVVEEKSVLERRIALKGTMHNQGFVLYQEGAPGKNLNDKLEVEVVFKTKKNVTTKVFKTTSLFDGSGPVTDASKLKISHSYVSLPSFRTSNTIKAKYNYSYVFRAPYKKSGSPEHEQKVKFFTMDKPEWVETDIEFLNTDELKNYQYSIINKDDPTERVWIKYLTGRDQLRMTSFQAADDLLSWLVLTSKTRAENYKLSFAGYDLYIGNTPDSATELTKSRLSDLLASYL